MFEQLMETLAALRSPTGCPWDRKQTWESLTPCLLEETYETIDAILQEDPSKVKEEVGDLLCILGMIAAIAHEDGVFSIADACTSAITKMRHRHPHVFGEATTDTIEEVKHLWHTAKEQEPEVKKRVSVLDDIAETAPALLRADKIQRRVARIGFDWDSEHDVIPKIEEELDELRAELNRDVRDAKRTEEEVGDLLFAVVNIARKLDINAEMALVKANRKFIDRFTKLERDAKEKKIDLNECSLVELEALWQKAKQC